MYLPHFRCPNCYLVFIAKWIGPYSLFQDMKTNYFLISVFLPSLTWTFLYWSSIFCVFFIFKTILWWQQVNSAKNCKKEQKIHLHILLNTNPTGCCHVMHNESPVRVGIGLIKENIDLSCIHLAVIILINKIFLKKTCLVWVCNLAVGLNLENRILCNRKAFSYSFDCVTITFSDSNLRLPSFLADRDL